MPGLTEQTPAFAGYETLETGQGEALDPLPLGQPSALVAGQQGGQTAREGGRPLFQPRHLPGLQVREARGSGPAFSANLSERDIPKGRMPPEGGCGTLGNALCKTWVGSPLQGVEEF